MNTNYNRRIHLWVYWGILVRLAVEATVVSECKGTAAPLAVEIEGCAEQPCMLTKGENAVMILHFIVPNNSDTLTAKVLAKIAVVSVPYPLPDPNVCHTLLNGYCPVDQGELLQYRLEMPVLASYPSIDLTIQLSIEDDTRKKITCFQVDCKVK